MLTQLATGDVPGDEQPNSAREKLRIERLDGSPLNTKYLEHQSAMSCARLNTDECGLDTDSPLVRPLVCCSLVSESEVTYSRSGLFTMLA